jgi:hypothetical protein
MLLFFSLLHFPLEDGEPADEAQAVQLITLRIAAAKRVSGKGDTVTAERPSRYGCLTISAFFFPRPVS